MDKYFALFGKVVLAIMVISLLIGVGIFLGEKLGRTSPDTPPTPINPQIAVITLTLTPTPFQEPSHFIIEAGGTSPFEAYTLSAVAGWTPTKTHNESLDQIILSKGDYQVSILEEALGGEVCVFPGDGAQTMSIELTNPIDIPLQVGQPLRRGTAASPTTGKSSFTICQKGSSGSYSDLTEFGVITYSTPLNPSLDMLSQMDGMVGSLQKQ